MLQVALERATAGRAQAVLGSRHPAFEHLAAGDVTRLLQLPGVDAEVAVSGVEQSLELVEAQRLVHRQRAHDREPHALVDEAIQLERRGRGTPAHAAERRGWRGGVRRRAVCMTSLGRQVGISHRTSER